MVVILSEIEKGDRLQTEFVLPVGRHEEMIFENSKGWLKPKEVSSKLGVSVKTIYDWNARKELRKVPSDLFVKLNGQLFLRKAVLLRWISSQNL